MDRETAELQQKLSATEAECKGLESREPLSDSTASVCYTPVITRTELATLNGTLTSDEARQQLKEVTEQVRQIDNLFGILSYISLTASFRVHSCSARQWRLK